MAGAEGAKAPEPGRKRKDKQVAQQAEDVMTLVITTKGHAPVRLTRDLVPMSEKIVVYRETRLSFEELMPHDARMPLHSVFVLWWVGRRLSDSPGLTFQQADAEWTAAGNNSFLDVSVDVEVDDSPEG